MDAEAAPFVARAGELALLGASLAAARAGQSQIVLVEGEAGIGKTALLRRCLRDVPDVTVVWASGDPTGSGIRFDGINPGSNANPPYEGPFTLEWAQSS
jgi:AAA ATPase-like protein